MNLDSDDRTHQSYSRQVLVFRAKFLRANAQRLSGGNWQIQHELLLQARDSAKLADDKVREGHILSDAVWLLSSQSDLMRPELLERYSEYDISLFITRFSKVFTWFEQAVKLVGDNAYAVHSRANACVGYHLVKVLCDSCRVY